MMYIDPEEKAVALNLDAAGEFLRKTKGKGVPAVMFTLFSQCEPNNHAYITADAISDHTGLSLSTIRRAIEKLRSAGIVVSCGDGDFLINPGFAFRGEQSDEKWMEFWMVMKFESQKKKMHA